MAAGLDYAASQLSVYVFNTVEARQESKKLYNFMGISDVTCLPLATSDGYSTQRALGILVLIYSLHGPM